MWTQRLNQVFWTPNDATVEQANWRSLRVAFVRFRYLCFLSSVLAVGTPCSVQRNLFSDKSLTQMSCHDVMRSTAKLTHQPQIWHLLLGVDIDCNLSCSQRQWSMSRSISNWVHQLQDWKQNLVPWCLQSMSKNGTVHSWLQLQKSMWKLKMILGICSQHKLLCSPLNVQPDLQSTAKPMTLAQYGNKVQSTS